MKKVAILLHCVGEDGIEAFNSFEFKNERIKKKLNVVLTKLIIIELHGRTLCLNHTSSAIRVNKKEKQLINLSRG